MNKIPTIFHRGDHFKVVNEPMEGCEWVFAGEGVATEKLDGTNVRITTRIGTIVRVEKRRNPDKALAKLGVVDPWYVDAVRTNPVDQHIWRSINNTSTNDWVDGEHCAEAIGPNIQGNPLKLLDNTCVPFMLEIPMYQHVPRSEFNELREFLATLDSKYSPGNRAEGLVFHHEDGRMAKIKYIDFQKGA